LRGLKKIFTVEHKVDYAALSEIISA